MQGVLLSTAAAEGTLNVYNWGEYIGEETIANFEKEFDIKVTSMTRSKQLTRNCLPVALATMSSHIRAAALVD